MSFLALAGMIGIYVYGGYCIKKEYECAVANITTKRRTNNYHENTTKIKQQFKHICKRCSIKTDKNGNPTSMQKCDIGAEYLTTQGYTKKEIEFYKKYFEDRYNQHIKTRNIEREEKFNTLLKKYNEAKKEDFKFYVFSKKVGYQSNPKERMQQIMKNSLWKTIVHHYDYIGGGNRQVEEIWTLYIPFNFFFGVNEYDLYYDICEEQNIYHN